MSLQVEDELPRGYHGGSQPFPQTSKGLLGDDDGNLFWSTTVWGMMMMMMMMMNPTYPTYNWGYNPLTKWDEPPLPVISQL